MSHLIWLLLVSGTMTSYPPRCLGSLAGVLILQIWCYWTCKFTAFVCIFPTQLTSHCAPLGNCIFTVFERPFDAIGWSACNMQLQIAVCTSLFATSPVIEKTLVPTVEPTPIASLAQTSHDVGCFRRHRSPFQHVHHTLPNRFLNMSIDQSQARTSKSQVLSDRVKFAAPCAPWSPLASPLQVQSLASSPWFCVCNDCTRALATG